MRYMIIFTVAALTISLLTSLSVFSASALVPRTEFDDNHYTYRFLGSTMVCGDNTCSATQFSKFNTDMLGAQNKIQTTGDTDRLKSTMCGYTDVVNSSGGFINRTYLSPNCDWVWHPDLPLGTIKAWDVLLIKSTAKYIFQYDDQVFAKKNVSPGDTKLMLYTKLTHVADLVNASNYTAAAVEMAQLNKVLLNDPNVDPDALITDPEVRQNLAPVLSDISSKINSMIPLTTQVVPEYGQLAALVLAISIGSIMIISMKSRLRLDFKN